MPIIFKLYVGRETLITFAMLFGMMLVTGLCLVILGLIYPHMKYFRVQLLPDCVENVRSANRDGVSTIADYCQSTLRLEKIQRKSRKENGGRNPINEPK